MDLANTGDLVSAEEQEDTQDLDQRLESQLESSIAAKVLLFVRDQSLSKSELAALLGHN